MKSVWRAVSIKLCWPVWLVVILALSACGGEDEETPNLSAPPTRTPVPTAEATDEPPSANTAPAHIEVRSLYGEIDAFLTASETASALDRVDLATEYIVTPAEECLTASFWPGWEPLQVINAHVELATANMVAWRESTDIFPEADLVQATNRILADLQAVLPIDDTLRVCLVPAPHPGDRPPDEAADLEQPAGETENPAITGLGALVLGSDLIVASCWAGDNCLNGVDVEIAFAYGQAYQIRQSGQTGVTLPLLDYAVYSGRNEVLARHFAPEATFPWTNALTPEQEATLWSRMQEYLDINYQQRTNIRKYERYLFGAGTEEYPTMGGLYIGSQIVRAYLESHPDTAYPELFALPPGTLLAESGYAPG
ncbi:MAG: hypothetical protein JXJ20_13515 [Anaerolineae bacterium]|nr:hypothetical protein [Anaerolineae bacterium]